MKTYHNVILNSKLVPKNTRVKRFDQKVCFFMRTTMAPWTIQVIRCSITSNIPSISSEVCHSRCYLLWTPVGHDTCKPHLFRVVGNIWAKAEDCSAEISIRAFEDCVSFHVWFEGLKDYLKTSMIQLSAKALEFGALSLTFAR